MGRIRTIKPEFPQSESMGRVSREARLCFLMLFTIVDDSGRTRGVSRMLASILFPYDDDAPELIDQWLDELDRENCIRRYMAEGQAYIQIMHWGSHQKIDRPTPSKIPAFDESSRILASPREPSSVEGIGREGIRIERELRSLVEFPENPEPEKTAEPSKTVANSKLRDEAKAVLAFLNEKTGHRYREVEANLSPIIARLKEGFTVKDCRSVVAMKRREWETDEQMSKYLRPATLFNRTNFANYEGQLFHGETTGA
jgi:uncharacterized phage protein (TIGR02220 family)